jgi:ATP-independent RNA helicase DbpA
MNGVRILSLTGGSPSRDQRAALAAGAHVVVATPGRCLQLLEMGLLNPACLTTLVLDEADTLLDMGFEEEVNRILSFLPPKEKRQTLLFSATWAERVEQLSARLQRRPEVISDGGAERVREAGRRSKAGLGKRGAPGASASLVDSALLRQSAVLFEASRGQGQRLEVLCDVLASALGTESGEGGCVVFCETRRQCKEVARYLVGQGAAALELHGELEQSEREKTLVRFRNKSCRLYTPRAPPRPSFARTLPLTNRPRFGFRV